MKVYQANILYKKVTKKILSFVFILLGLTACQSNSYKVAGDAKGLSDGDTLFLTNDLTTGIPSDTIIITNGKFSFSGEADSTSLCMIYSVKHNEINAPFFIEAGTITIHLSDQPGESRVSGTLCNDEWQELNDSVISIGKEINRIAEHIYGQNLTESEQQKGMEKIEKLNKRFSAFIIKTAEKNIDNEFGYFLLTFYPEELIDNATRSRLIKDLPAKIQKRPAIQQMKEAIALATKTGEGATINDFTQQALDGTEVSLMEEVKKNKITIIDFWASWCGPCRQEMPFMVQLYDQYNSAGLGIIGISLDNDHDAWQQATVSLGVKWPQMSDLKGWQNQVSSYFNVTAIPHTIIVDQNGKILRRGLRGEQLQQFISEYLK